MVRALLAGLFALPGCLFQPNMNVEHDDLMLDAVPGMVAVDLGAGDLSIFLTDGDQVEVRRTLRFTGERPTLSARVESGTLRLDVECRDFQLECRVDHEVFLPAGASISGGTGTGNVVIDGVPGDIDLSTGSGDIAVTTATGQLVLETGSGNILVDDIIGTVDLDTGSGLIDLRRADSATAIASTGSGEVFMDLVGTPSRVTIDTGSADVTLVVPSGVYRVDTQTGSGDVRIEGLNRDASADQVLDIETGSGDIRVTGN